MVIVVIIMVRSVTPKCVRMATMRALAMTVRFSQKTDRYVCMLYVAICVVCWLVASSPS